MRTQPHDDEEEDQTEEDESRNLLLPPAELRRDGGGSGSISSSSSITKRTGLLWTAASGATRGKPFSACSASAAAGAASTAPRLCRPSAFVLDLGMLVRVFFVRGLFVEQRWLFPVLLAAFAIGYEAAASTILSVIGEFYLAISSSDTALFLQASGDDCKL